MAKSIRIPAYRRHSSGQARVTISGKDHLLGAYGSEESKASYQRLIAEWLATPAKQQTSQQSMSDQLLVSELILKYWTYASDYYGFRAKQDRGDGYCLRDALKILRVLYGPTPAESFGPIALKAIRCKMIEKDWSRNYINAQIDRIRRMFRWAAGEELLPASIHQNLCAVASLRMGKSPARETVRVRPVPQADIDAALPFMPPTVRDMVQLQLLCGCRPQEVCLLRPIDLDRSDARCWIYRPGSDQANFGTHKTAHHERERYILIGPKAQLILSPYLKGPLSAYCFSPEQSEKQRNDIRRKNRTTPRRINKAAHPPTIRLRQPSDHYTTHSYRRAITRACQQAEKAAHKKAPSIPTDRVIVKPWSPNQLRHNRATELRRHGLDLVKTILGHSKIETTLLYAEKDLDSAKELVGKVG